MARQSNVIVSFDGSSMVDCVGEPLPRTEGSSAMPDTGDEEYYKVYLRVEVLLVEDIFRSL